MITPNSFKGFYCKVLRGWVLIAMLTGVAFITSCSDTDLNPPDTPSVSDQSLSFHQYNPHSILSRVGVSKNGTTYHLKNGPAADNNGFASPLFGLATAPNGDILVADAGSGVSTLQGTDISLPGVTDISPLGRGSLWASTGAGADPTMDTGQALYRLSQGKSDMVVNLFAFEQANDPDGNVDSNPFDVQSLGGHVALVADAGGNDLLRINNQGEVEVLAIFPNELVSTENIKNLFDCPDGPPNFCGLPDMIPAQAVPTSIAVGPDGYYYVGELKGFPAPAGASNIWRVSPNASFAMCGSSPDCIKVFEGGFTSIIDLAFDENGMLHVAELDEGSWFAVEFLDPSTLAGGTINACDVNSQICTEVATGIPILTAITFGKDGKLWATQNALIPGLAEVIEVP